MMAMATGDVNDISEVAAAVSEADVALRFAVMIRDKLLDGYAQLIRMSV
jgi:flagellar hook-basal body complex protein FliE